MSEVDHEALARLRAASDDAKKITEWNQYREDHPEWKPCLSDKYALADLKVLDLRTIDLTEVNLCGAKLQNANLNAAELRRANLSGAVLAASTLCAANLACANLSKASLAQADLSGADFQRANLSGAILRDANPGEAHLELSNLKGADLSSANVSRANLMFADLTDVRLNSANLADALIDRVTYDRSKMRGKYQGIRVATCYGNAPFKRDAQDQDFIDTLKYKLDRDLRKAKGWWRRASAKVKLVLSRAWGWTDYGRSLRAVALIAMFLAIVFGFIYALAGGMLDYRRQNPSWFTPFYYSIVTYTTLGFGDVTPKTTMGEMIVTVEVLLGYLTLGLLVSVLPNRVARRSQVAT